MKSTPNRPLLLDGSSSMEKRSLQFQIATFYDDFHFSFMMKIDGIRKPNGKRKSTKVMWRKFWRLILFFQSFYLLIFYKLFFNTNFAKNIMKTNFIFFSTFFSGNIFCIKGIQTKTIFCYKKIKNLCHFSKKLKNLCHFSKKLKNFVIFLKSSNFFSFF